MAKGVHRRFGIGNEARGRCPQYARGAERDERASRTDGAQPDRAGRIVPRSPSLQRRPSHSPAHGQIRSERSGRRIPLDQTRHRVRGQARGGELICCQTAAMDRSALLSFAKHRLDWSRSRLRPADSSYPVLPDSSPDCDKAPI